MDVLKIMRIIVVKKECFNMAICSLVILNMQ